MFATLLGAYCDGREAHHAAHAVRLGFGGTDDARDVLLNALDALQRAPAEGGEPPAASFRSKSVAPSDSSSVRGRRAAAAKVFSRARTTKIRRSSQFTGAHSACRRAPSPGTSRAISGMSVLLR